MGTKIKKGEVVKQVNFNIGNELIFGHIVRSKSGKSYAPLLSSGTRGKYTTKKKATSRARGLRTRMINLDEKEIKKLERKLNKNKKPTEAQKKKVEEKKKKSKKYHTAPEPNIDYTVLTTTRK